ncbi:MAG: hypothetical protein LBU32_06435 [Clostridiales bacterium]|jgi:rhamnulokinase|nr:hypothetical protein [Clostridiales bacterium]
MSRTCLAINIGASSGRHILGALESGKLILKEIHRFPHKNKSAARFLMIPDYLNFLLCGKAVCEYTNASSTQIVCAATHDWDSELIAMTSFTREIFPDISAPGTVLGEYNGIKVLTVASHDTGSAFMAVPARDENAVHISSGTWSLLGVVNSEPNFSDCSFTNEGGYGNTYCYLNNLSGLYPLQKLREETGLTFAGLEAQARRGRTCDAYKIYDNPSNE